MRRGIKKNRLLDFWVGIPVLNALAAVRSKRKWPEQAHRIGVMCSPALGDTLLFSAVACDLRYAFPDAQLVHLCMQQNLAAAELIGGIDRRVLLDLTRPLETIKAVRSQRLDVLLDFTSWQRLTALYTLLSGARFTAGFQTRGQHRGSGYDVVAEHRDDLHEVDNFRALLRVLEIPTEAEPLLVLPEVAQQPLADEVDVVVFHPWASGHRSALREWPDDRWLGLAHALADRDTTFAVTGAPSDAPRSHHLVQQMTSEGLRAVAFISPDGFASLANLLLRARLVISVNTGVMHLAAVIGATTVSINGPNRNGRWGPIGKFARGVEAPGDDCGYLHLGFNFDRQATDCMERISVEMIARAAEDAMRQRRSGA